MANSPTTLKEFFSTPEKPVSTKEMMDFWKELTEDEKESFRQADLSI